jgi:Protein of unknown function (DUF3313)
MNLQTRIRLCNAIVASAVVVTLAACTSTRPSPIDEPSLQEGLVRIETKAVDAAYRRPEATLAPYSKLLLRPIEVQFAKDWDPAKSGSVLYEMNEPDREKIKRDLAELFADEFKEDMAKGNYPFVDQAGPDVLEMRAAIVNLYITAPDVSMQTAGRTRVYTTEAGSMTLIMQLHDSVTGQLLARVYDQRSDQGSGMWTWTTSVSNSAEARRIISTWAVALRKAFDASRAPS